jgi:transposase-like protein
MSRARVAVLQIVSKQLTVTAAAAEYGISRRHLHRLLARYQEGGMDALEPRSRRPKTTPIATPETVRQRVIELRGQLTADGLDAGPVTIGWHLEREGLPALSVLSDEVCVVVVTDSALVAGKDTDDYQVHLL